MKCLKAVKDSDGVVVAWCQLPRGHDGKCDGNQQGQKQGNSRGVETASEESKAKEMDSVVSAPTTKPSESQGGSIQEEEAQASRGITKGEQIIGLTNFDVHKKYE